MMRANSIQPRLVRTRRIIRMPHAMHRFKRGMHDLIHGFERYVMRERRRADQRNRFR